MACRCGHSCTASGRPTHVASSASGSSGPASSSRTSSRRGERRPHDVDGLGDHRGAGRVEHHSPWPGGVEGRVQERALERHQLGEILGAAPPARLGTAPEGTETGARRVHQHPVEAAVGPGRPGAVRRHHAGHARGGRPQRLAHQLRPVRLPLGGQHPRTTFRGQRGEERCLAARARAQVEPVLVGAVHPGTREGDRDQLRPGVLHAGPSVAHGGHLPGVAAVEGHPERAQRRPPPELGDRGQPGPGDQGHPGPLVVRGEQRVELAGPAQRRRERLDHPARVGRGHGKVPGRVGGRVGGHPSHPAVEVVRGHLAQDRVDEAGRPVPDPVPHQVDGGGDRGVAGHAHRQQLVGAEPQRVEHRRVDGTVGQRREDGVVRALAAERAADQLGRQRRVTTAQPPLAEHLWQHQVGVGVVRGHRSQHVVRRQPGLVAEGVGQSPRCSLTSRAGATAAQASVSTSASSTRLISPSRDCCTSTAL